VGVKKSTSDLLVSACDEFIYYDDLVRERGGRKKSSPAARSSPAPRERGNGRGAKASEAAPDAPPAPGGNDRGTTSEKLQEAMDLILATVEALLEERGEDEPVWGSMVKQTLKRRHPGFNERYYGFGSFNELLEEARSRGYLELERDAKSGGYAVRPGAL